LSSGESSVQSGDDDESFESCEPQKDISANSPQLHSIQAPSEPSPSSAAVSALTRMSVDSSNPFLALDGPSSESSPAVEPLPDELTGAASTSVSPAAVSSSSGSQPHTPVNADDSVSGAKPADGTDGTDDVDQGQIFDCFDLKIVYERGRTGFEDTKEIDFTPGMLIAVSSALHLANGQMHV
jgi:hypothetical protein